ncbi:hypothetical protein HMPREF3038_00999 [Akkermansia sp. KLE1797]|nr:hypothetical protein HMPREF3038_00999 [Akkermansia sp. KLE1797]KZA05000.1 hypothetical protein HMPREF1326_01319 [Akkermansia sp. KLE1605]
MLIQHIFHQGNGSYPHFCLFSSTFPHLFQENVPVIKRGEYAHAP